jgi:hypothetical protein
MLLVLEACRHQPRARVPRLILVSAVTTLLAWYLASTVSNRSLSCLLNPATAMFTFAIDFPFNMFSTLFTWGFVLATSMRVSGAYNVSCS